MTRAALYARVSTEEQTQKYGLASQLRELRAAAATRGYQIAAEFIDDGASGASLNRAALDRLRASARATAVDVVLVHDPDRLARKLVDQLILTDEIERAGVRIEFLTITRDVTPEGELLLQVKGVIAEYERKKIVERTQRGRRERARSGKVSVYPYGYRKGAAGDVVVEEAEAETVRMIFAWLIDEGRSVHSIVCGLRDLGIAPPRGARWAPTTLRRLVRNPYYAGRTWYNRAGVVHGPEGARRTARPETDWIAIDVPAILTPERLTLADRRLAENRVRLAGRPGRVYLLRGLVRCGECSRRMTGDFSRGWPRYRCPGHRTYVAAEPCVRKSVSARDVDIPVWKTVMAVLRDPGLIERKMAERQTRAGVREIEVRSELEHLERELAKLDRDEQRLVDLYVAEDVDLPTVRTRLTAVRERRQAVAGRLERARPVVASAGADEAQHAATQRACARLLKAAEDLDDVERREFLATLLDEVVVRGRELDIHGVLPTESFHEERQAGVFSRAS